jgi:hypothetical protein
MKHPTGKAAVVLTIAPGECKKAAKILASFVDPHQAFGPDKIIPPSVLSQAKVSMFQFPTSDLQSRPARTLTHHLHSLRDSP